MIPIRPVSGEQELGGTSTGSILPPLEQRGVRFEIGIAVPSLNAVYGRHWGAKHKIRKEWGWRVRAALLEIQCDSERNVGLLRLRGHVTGGGRVMVGVETWRARRLDDENLRAGFKPAMDAMRSEGLMVDDHPKWIDTAFRQHAGRPHRTVIEIWPV
ncbi:MAG: hypothetical protein KGL39_47345 [Patescibacteria group bacterium]|nr:hypothetical protein [Patescibacteria group bacterium]